ncbi:MAG TPA: preprotein translocase subunit SecG [Steroidobacteraceae bacterium]|nr:preprotein translocase subunit SecG [Steroidobacteraceae bacterium]
MRIALTFSQFFCALMIIGLVLIQRGKGAEAGAGFGAGASGTVFGARGAGTALSRATAIFAALFMLNSLALGYVGSHQPAQPKTILDTAGETPTVPAGSALPSVPPRAAAPAASSGAAGGAPASVPGTPAPSPGSVPAPTPAAPGPK